MNPAQRDVKKSPLIYTLVVILTEAETVPINKNVFLNFTLYKDKLFHRQNELTEMV